MRSVISLWLLVISSLASAQVIHLTSPCSVAASKTECFVWPLSIEPITEIAVKSGDTSLAHTYKSFSEIADGTASVMLLQVDKLADSRQKQLFINALAGAAQSLKIYQDFGVYSNAPNLGVQSALGNNKAALVQAIKSLSLPTASALPLSNLNKLASIVGGSQAKRKTVFWLSTGAVLSQEEQRALLTKFDAENVRLVMLHVKTSELDQNAGAELELLFRGTPHLKLEAGSNEWQGLFAKLVHYSHSGGQIVFDSSTLCGEKAISINAKVGGQAASKTENLSYGRCEVQSPVPNTATNSAPSTATTPAPNEATPAQNETTPTPDVTPDVSVPSTALPLSFSSPAYTFSFSHEANHESVIGRLGVAVEESVESVQLTIFSGNDENIFQISDDGSLTFSAAGIALVENDYDLLRDEYNLTVQATSGARTGSANVSLHKMAGPLISKQQFLIVAAVVGFLILLLILVILFKRGKKEPAYGYLVDLGRPGGRQIPLIGVAITLGRGGKSNILLNNDTVTSEHAVIKRTRSGSVNLVDLHSSNGTRVNGVEIKDVELKSGDSIELGEYKLRIELN